MTEINNEIVEQMKAMAQQGEQPANILHRLADLLPTGPARKVSLIKYMRAAFGLTLEQASPIAGWSGEVTSELSDARLNELLAPVILEKRAHWVST
jgi:hypothetical protein